MQIYRADLSSSKKGILFGDEEEKIRWSRRKQKDSFLSPVGFLSVQMIRQATTLFIEPTKDPTGLLSRSLSPSFLRAASFFVSTSMEQFRVIG